MREMRVTPHVARNDSNRSAAIDGRTTRHPGYAISQTLRKRVEECSGWAKTIGGLRKSRFIGREKLDFQFTMRFAAHNLIPMRNPGGDVLMVQPSRGWYARIPVVLDRPAKRARSHEENRPDWFEYRMMTVTVVRFSTAC
jgi:hypothetical protein